MDEEFGDLAEQFSDPPSSVHDPERRPEPADNTHRGMKYYIHHYTILYYLVLFIFKHENEATKTIHIYKVKSSDQNSSSVALAIMLCAK